MSVDSRILARAQSRKSDPEPKQKLVALFYNAFKENFDRISQVDEFEDGDGERNVKTPRFSIISDEPQGPADQEYHAVDGIELESGGDNREQLENQDRADDGMPLVQEEQALVSGFFASDDAEQRQDRAQIHGDALEDEAYIEINNNDSDGERRLPILDRPNQDIAQKDEEGPASDGEDAEPQNEGSEERESGVPVFAPEQHEVDVDRDLFQVEQIDVEVAEQEQEVLVNIIADVVARPGEEENEEEAQSQKIDDDDYGEESVA